MPSPKYEKVSERDLARGVCMEVERATGRFPRPRRIWPHVLGIIGYMLMVLVYVLAALAVK